MSNLNPDLTREWQTAILRRELCRQARNLRMLSEKLQERSGFANKTPSDFAVLVGRLADILDRQVESAPEPMLQRLGLIMCSLGQELQHVEHSRIAHTPWSLIPAFEAFSRSCTTHECRFLISPQWTYNYGVSPDVVAALTKILYSLDWVSPEEWRGIGEFSQSSKLHFLYFPQAERKNVLLHAILAHELGHILTQEAISAEFGRIWLEEEGRVESAFRAEACMTTGAQEEDIESTASIQSTVASQTEHAKRVARRAFEELAADYVAVHLLGPAAFAALAEFAARKDLDAKPLASEDYPPWRFRLRWMAAQLKPDLDMLASSGTTNEDADSQPVTLLQPFLLWLRQTIEVAETEADTRILNREPVTREAFVIVEKRRASILSKAQELMPEPYHSPYRLSERLPAIHDLVLKMRSGIPPNEAGTWPNTSPADIRDILSAGWAYKYLQIAEDPAWATSENLSAMFRLMLKGIEASHVHARYGPLIDKVEAPQ